LRYSFKVLARSKHLEISNSSRSQLWLCWWNKRWRIQDRNSFKRSKS